MKLKILIAEDKQEELENSVRVCKRLSTEEGFTLNDEDVVRSSTIEDTIELLEKKPFEFDVVILDVGFGEGDMSVDKLSDYLKADTLVESKVIIHSGNPAFKTDPDRILTAICNGVRTIAIKGEPEGELYSFERQFKRVLQDIKFEVIWANIGRFTPQWKRDLFRKNSLWKDLRGGKKTEKVFMLIDISNSTQFVITQRHSSIDDRHILEFFKSFANLATDIIEKDDYKGIIERYSGDEILAYFDYNPAQEKCKTVINCANAIIQSFNERVEELYTTYGFSDVISGQNTVKPQLRILISCGEIMWVLQGADSRPQLSIMTDKVAKFYRCFTDRDKNYHRTIQPNTIYITHDVYINVKNDSELKFEKYKQLDLRDFGNLNVYNLKN